MKQSGGRDDDGGVHRGRGEDVAGGGRGPLRKNSGGGDAAPTPRATGLPPRAPAGRTPMARAGPRVLERHRDAEEFPRERETTGKEEEAPALAVRPRGAPPERSEEAGDSASCGMGQRSAATALGGRGRRERLHDAVDYPHGDESPSLEAGALVVRPRGARRESAEGGGASEAGAAGRPSPATALGGRGRLGHNHDAVEWPRESEPPSRDSGALVVRARGALQERPVGVLISDPSAAGQRSPATAHLGRHHGGLVSPHEREPRRVEGRPRGLLLEELEDHRPRQLSEGSLGAPGKLWGFEANGEVSDDAEPQHRRGVTSPGAKDSREGRDTSKDLQPRPTSAPSTQLLDVIDMKGGHKSSTAAVVHDETSAEAAPDGGGLQSLGCTQAGERGSCYKPSCEPESSSAAASEHRHPSQGMASTASMQAENPRQSEMFQSIVTELLENKGILDVEVLESWLMQKERHSTVTYFETRASRAQRIWYNKWSSCLPEYIGNTSDLSHKNAFRNSYCHEIPEQDLEEIFHKIQLQNYKCAMKDLVKGSLIAMCSLQEFLCRSCLDPDPSLEFSALRIILAAANSKINLQILGTEIRIIGIAVVKTYIGSPKVQNQALKLLSKLCGLHENTKRILDLGGFCCAVHVLKFSALGAEPAAQLVSTLLESECSYPSIFKDHLPYHLVKAVGLGWVKEASTIEDILLVASKVELAQIGFFDALVILKPGSTSKNLLLGILSRVASSLLIDDD